MSLFKLDFMYLMRAENMAPDIKQFIHQLLYILVGDSG